MRIEFTNCKSGGRLMEWQTKFNNEPNFLGVIRVLCDLLSTENKGRYEYTYTVSEKDDKKET